VDFDFTALLVAINPPTSASFIAPIIILNLSWHDVLN